MESPFDELDFVEILVRALEPHGPLPPVFLYVAFRLADLEVHFALLRRP
jgi:hypothetical protein